MSEQSDPRPAAEDRSRPKMGRRLAILVVLLIGSIWATQLRGIVSSNDGSHIALARALALRGRPEIDPEVMLTLMVDRARRGEHEYSDRPPGTAFVALPAIWAATPLDERWRDRSLARMRAQPPPEHIEDTLVFPPATPRYIETYGARRQEVGGPSPNLLALQGTAALVGVHCIAMGLAGLGLVLALSRNAGVDARGRLVAVLAVGLASLWGPYSTALFSHATAGVALAACVLGLVRCAEAPAEAPGWRWALLAGLGGGWAVACDYALLVAVVPLGALLAPRRAWPLVLAGAVPIALATGWYHQAAFGSPWSIGYDHQTNFEFARERGATFSGNPLTGLWVLWGAGRGAGVLVQSPILLLGLAGLAMGPRRRWLYGLLPWMVLLVFHRTPWGGASFDHRYLVPAIPLLGVGIALAWQRWVTDGAADGTGGGRWWALGIVVLGSVSGMLTWANFWAWRG